MLSLKRLLNDDHQVSGQGFSEEAIRNEIYMSNPAQSDIPFLADTSWEALWGDIFSADFSDGNDMFQMNFENNDNIPINNVEECIESWATQTMPLTNEPSPNSERSPPEASPLDHSGINSPFVCYGMVYRAAARVGGNMLEIDANLKQNIESSPDGSYIFGMKKGSLTQIVLCFLDGTEFGTLNNHTSEAINELIQQPMYEFEAIGSIKSIRDVIGRVTKMSDALVRININIYGPRGSNREVGRRLSAQKVYLQRPDRIRKGSVYENPHFLAFADMEISSLENRLDVGGSRAPKLDDAEKFRDKITTVYSGLTRGTKLNKVEGDRRLKTPLLPHQEEALDFMLQRENGPIPPEYRLWKAMAGENEGWYQHAVTKARNRILATETGGGILADEMGMGKSLSTLALITKTLDKAHEWVAEQKASSDTHSRQTPCKATLVVVPSAILINEWFHQIALHLDGTLTVVRYHGSKRKALSLDDAHILLTTYHTLVSDFNNKSSPLHSMEWYRIVLDEAHIIRRQVTTFFRAVTDLKARSRWCLTGTPIQNKLEDIGSLFAFIRAHPFHSIAMFRRFVSIPFDESEERLEMATKNLTLLLESICLRRSRDLLHLPETKHKLRVIEFSPLERDQYEQTKKIMNRALRHKVGESYKKSIFGMFQVQLQLRILCNHGTYQQAFSWTRRSLLDEREGVLCSLEGSGEVHCSACRQALPVVESNDLYRTYRGNCAHVICRECLDQNENFSGVNFDLDRYCPLCAVSGVKPTTIQPDTPLEERSDCYLRESGHSSKMVSLMSDVRENLWQTKSIIFSCWTNTLNLIERHLRKEEIPFYRIDGEISLDRRQKILDEFSTTSEIPVLIMTTGTGAFGLNLMAANRVFIIEPQWNPSVENQAVARAIRINQKKSVLVTRYMIAGTVEQEMRSQQKRKLMIAEIGNNPS